MRKGQELWQQDIRKGQVMWLSLEAEEAGNRHPLSLQ